VQHQCEEADQGVGSDAVGQPMENRRDFDFALEDVEAPLDVGQALVALHHVGCARSSIVGDQHQLAIHDTRLLKVGFVDRPTELLVLEIYLDDPSQSGIDDLPTKDSPATGVRSYLSCLTINCGMVGKPQCEVKRRMLFNAPTE
jgi:hypothetical protein